MAVLPFDHVKANVLFQHNTIVDEIYVFGMQEAKLGRVGGDGEKQDSVGILHLYLD